VYMPCLTASNVWTCSTPHSTYHYDGLNRISSIVDGAGNTVVSYTYTPKTRAVNGVTQNVMDVLATGGGAQTNTEYDALGHAVTVCEVSSQTGNAPCSQGAAYNGFLTTNTFDAQGHLLSSVKGSQTRSFAYDGVGRITSVTYPEGGTLVNNQWQAATTAYYYDSWVGACNSTSPGDLVLKVDQNGNASCYVYDGLHRLLSVGQIYSTQNTASTPDKCFVYDAATVNGVAMNNSLGRMAEAYTTAQGTGCGATKITDEGFNYNRRGELVNLYESTPHSGGYYNTSASYLPDHGLGSVGGLIGTTNIFATINYTVDGMGRGYSAMQGGTTLAKSVVYSLFNDSTSSPTITASLGLGDTDTYTFDPHTGRMSQYQFSVGATPSKLTGVLGWNANGTLNTQNITDNLSSQTQNCSYGYNDTAEISSVNCLNGSTNVWNQNFSYDVVNGSRVQTYGNITKSVPTGGTGIAWNPGYNSANNHYTLSGTTYDANGYLTNDSMASYTWNAYGKLATLSDSTNSETMTYDAFDRLVELANNGTNTEYLFSPIGFLGKMNGTTAQQLWFPLPGGAKYNLSDKLLHPDFQGSIRLQSTRSNQTVAGGQMFAPFGEMYANSGSNYSFLFTGDSQLLTSNSGGLYDTPNRELRARQGRWISPDPSGGLKSLYAYANNNPLTFTDPTGLCGEEGGTPCYTGAGDGAISDDLTSADPGSPDPNSHSSLDSMGFGPPDVIASAVFIPGLETLATLQPTTSTISGVIMPDDYTTSTVNGEITPNDYSVQVTGVNFTQTSNSTGSSSLTDLAAGSGGAVGGSGGGRSVVPGSRLANGDTAVGIDIFHNSSQCPNCASIWNSANTWGNVAFGATAAVVTAPVAASVASSALPYAADFARALPELGLELYYNPATWQFVSGLASGLTPGPAPVSSLPEAVGTATGQVLQHYWNNIWP
jgi:RHS repeat-associated protein